MPDTFTGDIYNHRFDDYFENLRNNRRKIKCVIDAATTTGTFIGDFISDRIQNATNSLDTDSDLSPTFFKSSSSSHHTVFQSMPHELIEDQATYKIPLSSELSEKANFNLTNSNVITSLVSTRDEINQSNVKLGKNINSLPSTVDEQDHSFIKFSTTTSDTFDFLFAPTEKESANKGTSKIDTEIRSVGSKRVNFHLKSDDRSDTTRDSKGYTSIINRNVSSFFYSQKDMSSGDNLLESPLISKATIPSPRALERRYSPSIEIKHDSYLPSCAEGDTCDSQSEMIKIYPKEIELKQTRLQLFNYLHHEDNRQSTVFTPLSDTSKVKIAKSANIIRPLKIFSKYHGTSFSQLKANKEENNVRNRSIKMIKWFHQTLTHIDD